MAYWTPEPRFAGRTVVLLGGGPSLAAVDLSRLDPAVTIAVNTAGELMPDAAVLFWRDARWFADNRELVAGWKGLAVTTAPRAPWPNIRAVALERRPGFPPAGATTVRWGPSSGHVACALAVAMRATKIVLLGFDCRAVGPRTHWHDRYRETRAEAMYRRFVDGWRGWAADARALGAEIVNATPGSAIDDFPIVPLDQVLDLRRAA